MATVQVQGGASQTPCPLRLHRRRRPSRGHPRHRQVRTCASPYSCAEHESGTRGGSNVPSSSDLVDEKLSKNLSNESEPIRLRGVQVQNHSFFKLYVWVVTVSLNEVCTMSFFFSLCDLVTLWHPRLRRCASRFQRRLPGPGQDPRRHPSLQGGLGRLVRHVGASRHVEPVHLSQRGTASSPRRHDPIPQIREWRAIRRDWSRVTFHSLKAKRKKGKKEVNFSQATTSASISLLHL